MGVVDYLILALMAGVLVVLMAGVYQMLTGKNPRRSNQLMVWRVALQAVVILLAGLFLATK
jgi:hypothetical protein